MGHKITAWQASLLLTGSLLGDSLVINPAADSGTDAMISFAIGWAGGYLIFLLVALVARLHPGKSLTGILCDCFGRRAGSAVALLYGLLFLGLAGVTLNVYGIYEMIVEYPETPKLYINICFMLVVAFVVRLGIETLGRISEVFMFVFAVIVSLTFATLFIGFHVDSFMPVLPKGILPPLRVGLRYALLPFSECAVAFAVFPSLDVPKDVFRVANRTAVLVGVFQGAITLRDIVVVGVDFSARNVYPAEKIFRLMPGIDIYPLLDIDVIAIGILATAVYLYAGVTALGEACGLAQPLLLTFPAAALATAAAEWYTHSIFQQEDVFSALPAVFLPAFFLIPLLLLIISLVQGASSPPGAPAPAAPPARTPGG